MISWILKRTWISLILTPFMILNFKNCRNVNFADIILCKSISRKKHKNKKLSKNIIFYFWTFFSLQWRWHIFKFNLDKRNRFENLLIKTEFIEIVPLKSICCSWWIENRAFPNILDILTLMSLNLFRHFDIFNIFSSTGPAGHERGRGNFMQISFFLGPPTRQLKLTFLECKTCLVLTSSYLLYQNLLILKLPLWRNYFKFVGEIRNKRKFTFHIKNGSSRYPLIPF